MFEKIFLPLQQELERNADKQFREKIRDYFKMDVSNYLGVRLPLVRKIANKHFKEISELDVDQVLEICDKLLESSIYEHKVIAFHWSYKCKKQFQSKHFKIFESWLKTYVNDWSDCDALSTHSLGYLVFHYP
jgi:3-methyladenine DNA glycosylase AlkD